MVKVANVPGRPEVIGAFPSEANARSAVQNLRARGIAHSAIHVRRREVALPPPPEAPLLGRVFWSGFWWSIAGGLLGALLGLLVGLAGLGLPGTPDNLTVQVASWAMFLHVAGALAGCYAALDTGDRFAQKADHHDEHSTLVRVSSTDETVIRTAEHVLTEAGASTVKRTNS